VLAAVEEESGGVGRKAQSAGARVAGGYVPFSGLLRNTAVAMDPRVVDKQSFGDELSAGIPGLRNDLPPRLDTLGNPLTISTGRAGGFSPIVPTENQVADPDLAENVGRLRYTIERRRSEINRTLEQVKDARKLKDGARVKALSASLPPLNDRVQPDVALGRVRGLEDRLRRLRANDRLPPEKRREQETRLQRQMETILQQALARLPEAP
jgi:hypothetical protein